MVDKNTMKTVRSKSAKLDFEITELSIPKPAEGEVLVKLACATIHPSDTLKAVGFFGPVEYPLKMGLEGYGEVIEDNSGSDLKGKYVAFWSLNTYSWSEYTTVPVIDLIEAPKYEKEDLALASNFYLNPVTAIGLLNLVNKEGADAIGFDAGYSQVSQMLIRLCKQKGIKTLAVVRKDEQVKGCLELGVDEALNIKDSNFDQDFESKAKSLGVSVFFECVGGEDGNRLVKLLPNNTKVYTYGELSGEKIPEKTIEEIKNGKGINIEFFLFVFFYYKLSKDEKKALSEKIAKEIKSTFKTTINKTFKLDQIETAFQEYNNDLGKGKVVIEF